MNTYCVIGPPGTGKTRFLAKQIEKWTETGEYQERDFTLTSYSRAAAQILRGRVAIPDEQIATLHSLGYRVLGRPPIAEVAPLVDDWNGHVPPAWQMHAKTDTPETGVLETATHSAYEEYTYWRGLGSPSSHPLAVKLAPFVEKWTAFKQEHQAVDFADMIDLPRRRGLPLPGRPPVFIVDEAQDLVPAQWELVKYWASDCERVLLAGDPAQTIYSWIGARPDDLLAFGTSQRTLGYSYRLPVQVHKFAERWLTRHTGQLLRNREYRPRDAEGSVRRLNVHLKDESINKLIDDIESRPGRVMVLTTCAYMLTPLIARLRTAGIPFHNPYRKEARQWNPLAPAREGQTSTIDRLLAFLRPDRDTWGEHQRPWSLADVQHWLPTLRKDVFEGTRKGTLASLEDVSDLTDRLLELLTPKAALEAATLNARWLADNATARYQPLLQYGAAIWERFSGAKLRERPRLTLGTIHSVKGGEADIVYVSPDLSYQAYRQQFNVAGRDALIRLFYVAFTRAREELVLLNPTTKLAIQW